MKSSQLKANDMVKVMWDDHGTVGNWETIKELIKRESYVCESIGYYVGQNKKAIFVVQGLCRDTETTFNTQLILKSAIVSMKRLK